MCDCGGLVRPVERLRDWQARGDSSEPSGQLDQPSHTAVAATHWALVVHWNMESDEAAQHETSSEPSWHCELPSHTQLMSTTEPHEADEEISTKSWMLKYYFVNLIYLLVPNNYNYYSDTCNWFSIHDTEYLFLNLVIFVMKIYTT